MLKTTSRFITLCLILALAIGLVPIQAAAAGHDSDQDQPVRLYARAFSEPIGKIEGVSVSFINGRAVNGEQALWGGELLQAPVGRHLRVSLDQVGLVTLQGGAIAKLAVTRRRFDDNVDGAVLVAALIKGKVAVKLNAGAEAYIEASGSAITATRGSDFLLGLDESGPALLTASGHVAIQGPVRQGNYLIRPVGNRANIDVRLRKSRQVQFIVTDEQDKPVPDVPVVIAISGGGATLGSGAATVTVTTTASGVATTSVSAGTAAGASTITATVPGGATTSLGVSAVPGAIIGGTTLAVVGAVAAAGTAATVAVVKNKDNKSDIQQTSPPRITPLP